jgi:hypothetical protein
VSRSPAVCCGAGTADNNSQIVQSRLLSVFDCDQQDQLAHAVYTMTAFRKQCLSLPHGSHIATVNSIQQIVEEDVELIRIGYMLSLMGWDFCLNCQSVVPMEPCDW